MVPAPSTLLGEAIGPGRLRMLLLADTHVGHDAPLRPRVERRRRGDDMLACYERALAPALRGEVDVVIHAGDLFDRPRVPDALVERGLAPLRSVAEAGVAVILVPGNHERSRIRVPLLLRHPELRVFAEPSTFVVHRRGLRVAFGGFPYARDGVRFRFGELVEHTRLGQTAADARVLCIHHCVEGATCGPADHTFRTAEDVVRAADLPASVALVVAGHVHRHQWLVRDLVGRALAAPVVYPGSVDRTSFAEKNESKHCVVAELASDGSGRGCLVAWQRMSLPARPMHEVSLAVAALDAAALERLIERALSALPVDAVVRLRLADAPRADAAHMLRASALRGLAPPTMSVQVYAAGSAWRASRSVGRRTANRRFAP